MKTSAPTPSLYDIPKAKRPLFFETAAKSKTDHKKPAQWQFL